MLALCTGLLASGCGGDDGDTTGGSDDGSTGAAGETSSTTSGTAEDSASSDDAATDTADDVDPSSGDSTGGGSTDGGSEESGGGSETGAEVEWDEDFVWVADFLRTNCVQCHPTNVNGALLLPSVEMTNDEVRLALDGIVANTGLLLVEPFDREASQTWLQITNEFGAQFPVEDTDRFGAWIDAGASYYAP
jgi:hypothetical protein